MAVIALALGLALAGHDRQAMAETPAKQLFGAKALPAKMRPQPVGFYSRGCLAGGVAIPVDGPAWQVMRLSRNRRWAHPELVGIIEDLSQKAKSDGWNGLMVGDMSQPRGGPMLTGHASHQVGLDADIWFMPMPDKRLTYREREELSAVSVLKPGTFYVDDARWTRSHEQLLRHAAAYPQVQRILVHPGVKKKLCDTVEGDRAWLAKIRPFYGHHYHFHLRIRCPEGAASCKPQDAVPAGTGCDREILDWWFKSALVPRKPQKPTSPKKPRQIQLSDLPGTCAAVLEAPDVPKENTEYPVRETAFTAPALDIPEFDPLAILASRPIEKGKRTPAGQTEGIPVPTPRPADLTD
ncbi:MAG: penicillin-insensitive murein endopeptidase [Pseudomonadota bacterium]|nr:penicillin-insensitive murein endopeptidase [Pseudomonadota bacterium]